MHPPWTTGLRAIIAVLLLALASCATPAPGRTSAPPAPTPHATLDDLRTATSARLVADGSLTTSGALRLTLNGEVVSDSSASTFTVSHSAHEFSSRTQIRTRLANGASEEIELLLFSDEAYLKLDPRESQGGRPYLLLSPEATDTRSLLQRQVVESVRSGRAFCLSELGRAEIAETVAGEVDGKPVLRYALTTDLSSGSAVPLLTDFYRQLGLTTLRSTVVVDADDRVVRCLVDQELPDGSGRIWADEQMVQFGGPVTIARPASEEVRTSLR